MKRKIYTPVITAMLFGICAVASGKSLSVTPPDEYADSVAVMFDSGNWEGGFPTLEEGLSEYPDDPVLNELAGEYYYNIQDYERARYFLYRAVQDKPDMVKAKYLMVSVEEQSGNYSSAICYVNELLEVMPYHQDLWMRKVTLYRLQGNDVEADRLLKRLVQIYPNDSTVRSDYRNRLEENYMADRKQGLRSRSVSALEELVVMEPGNEQYHADLASLLLQEGRQSEALDAVSAGLAHVPGSMRLSRMYAGILSDSFRYQEALAFLQKQYAVTGDPEFGKLYRDMMLEAASKAKDGDPYEMYRKVYETQKSQEALDYLISASVMRNYTNDALYYISEARKLRGDTFDLMMKEYEVRKRISPDPDFLRKIDSMYPGNYDVMQELAEINLAQGDRLAASGQYGEALVYFSAASGYAREEDTAAAARMRYYSALVSLKRYEEADSYISGLEARGQLPEGIDMVLSRSDLLKMTGRYEEALDLLYPYARYSGTGDDAYRTAYEEISLPYIRQLIGAGAVKHAGFHAKRLLEVSPSSVQGLEYAISTAALAGDKEGYYNMTGEALALYPDNPSFLVSRASALSSSEDYAGAVSLLEPVVDSLSGNQALTGTYASNANMLALSLMKRDSLDKALDITGRAMRFDDREHSLAYTRGLVYEKMHEYDSAYFYQRQYRPSDAEYPDFSRKLSSLRRDTYRNSIYYATLLSRGFDSDALMAVHSLGYWRRLGKGHMEISADYTARGGYSVPGNQDGGVGFQLRAEYGRVFRDVWSANLRGTVSNGYFPYFGLSADLTRYLEKDWEVSADAGYRRLRYSMQEGLFQFGAGTAKTWSDLRLSADADAFVSGGAWYFNGGAALKYFPGTDGKTGISAHISAGTAPETDYMDYAVPASFRYLNMTAGASLDYFITDRLSVLADLSYYTYYTPVEDTAKYNNMIICYVRLSFFF